MRRNTKDDDTGSLSATARTQVSASVAGAIAGRILPDHELSVLGIGNVTRYFDLDDPSNGPSTVFRRVQPYYGFTHGFSNVGDDGISEGDTEAATDVTEADVTKPLYPITPMAFHTEVDLWPILSNLFSSGTGVRHNVTYSEFIRYTTMLLDAYKRMLTVLIVNNLAYHFDWTKVFPFTGVVPIYIYDMAANLDATDVGLASRWLPLLRRFDNKIIFPAMVAEMKRMLTPMLSIDLNARLLIPTPFNIEDYVADDIYKQVIDKLDYLDVQLASASALFTSFLPFPMSASSPWDLPNEPVIDVDRMSGWYNSSTKSFSVFNDSNDPDRFTSIAFVTDEGELKRSMEYYFTRHTQPIWAEIKLSQIFSREIRTVDNVYMMLTPHYYAKAFLLDDSGEVIEYDGSDFPTSGLGYRYSPFPQVRFLGGHVEYGRLEPGLLGAEIGEAAVRRLMRLETSFVFELNTLKTVSVNMAGASIREIRYSIQGLVQEGINSRV